jgi:hypothetical protein
MPGIIICQRITSEDLRGLRRGSSQEESIIYRRKNGNTQKYRNILAVFV